MKNFSLKKFFPDTVELTDGNQIRQRAILQVLAEREPPLELKAKQNPLSEWMTKTLGLKTPVIDLKTLTPSELEKHLREDEMARVLDIISGEEPATN